MAGKFPEMINPSNTESLPLSHKGRTRAAALASWDAAMGSDGERVQTKGNAASSTFQPGQLADEAVGAWERVMATILSPPPHHHSVLQDSLPPAQSAVLQRGK